MNEISLNQFYLREENNSRILYNLSHVTKILQLQEKVMIYLKDDKSFSEVFKDQDEAEEYIKYVIGSINQGSKIISRAIFNAVLKEIEGE